VANDVSVSDFRSIRVPPGITNLIRALSSRHVLRHEGRPWHDLARDCASMTMRLSAERRDSAPRRVGPLLSEAFDFVERGDSGMLAGGMGMGAGPTRRGRAAGRTCRRSWSGSWNRIASRQACWRHLGQQLTHIQPHGRASPAGLVRHGVVAIQPGCATGRSARRTARIRVAGLPASDTVAELSCRPSWR
jgi:hypothetical protein